MAEVPMLQTNATLAEVRDTASLVDSTLSPKALDLLVKHVHFENGGGTTPDTLTGLMNWDAGNLTANLKTWQGDFWRPPWFTLTADSSTKMKLLHAKMLQGKAPEAFRAHTSLAAGLQDYLGSLAHTFPRSYAAMRGGEPDVMGDALIEERYCPDCKRKDLRLALGGTAPTSGAKVVVYGGLVVGALTALVWLWRTNRAA